jgi:hypothetical protein
VPKPTRKTQRRWTLLPAIFRDQQDPLRIEGSAILDELPGDTGLFVWQFFRDTKLWAEADETERPFLFAPSALQRRSDDMQRAALEPAARTHVEAVLAIMYGGGDQETMSGAAVALAGWASARGAVHTAVAFALGSAILRPDDASAALLVARHAADADRAAFARLWLQRSIALARQAGDWLTYADAWVEQGRRFFLQPDHPVSRARAHLSFSKALRAARRHSLQVPAGRAHLGLVRLAAEADDLDTAVEHAEAAVLLLSSSPADLETLRQVMATMTVAPERMDAETRILLTHMWELERDGSGFEVRQVRGWSTPEKIEEATRVWQTSEKLRALSRRGAIYRENIQIPGASGGAVLVFRVTNKTAARIAAVSGMRHTPVPPPDAAPEQRVFIRPGVQNVLTAMIAAAGDIGSAQEGRWIAEEPEWRTSRELTRWVMDEHERTGKNLYFHSDDLRWGVSAGLAERKNVPAPRGGRDVAIYRVTILGGSVQPVQWHEAARENVREAAGGAA